MTIFILSQDHAETAKWLDNRSLDKMIKDIAQVIVTAATWEKIHEYEIEKAMTEKALKNIPKNKTSAINMKSMTQIKIELKYDDWVHFSRKCRANYLWLVSLLDHLLWEKIFRFKKLHDGKYHEIFKWARDNVPDLPERVKIKQYIGAGYFGEIATDITPPVVMPRKYHALTPYSKPEDCGSSDGGLEIDVFESYRNYYQARLNRKEPFMQFKRKDVWTRRQKPEWLKLEVS